MRAPLSKVLSLTLAVGFALATGETASARPKKHRVEPPVPPKVERSVLPITLDESAIPISVQGLPKRPARSEDQPKERAERPRTIRAAAAPTCRRFWRRARRRCRSSRPCPFRSRRRSTAWAAAPSIAARVSAQCGSAEQPHQSRLLGALLRDPHAPPRARTAAHNQPFSGKPKALDQHAIFDDPCCLNFRRSPSPFGHGAGVAYACGQGIVRTGEAAMTKVLNEILLFSSMAVFVTGIVLAAARLLI